MSPRIFVAAVTSILVGVAHVGAWGIEGHKAVGELARVRINSATRAHIVKILGNDDLADVAVWADQVRDAGRHRGPLKDDPEAKAFVKEFPHNDKWHFVDQPLGAKVYTDNGKFSRDDDVVHQINLCIAVLEGNSTKFTLSQALRLLVHLVGDIHQPLHTGSGFYDVHNLAAPKLVTDPTKVDVTTGDRGGNSLHITKSQELHAYFDATLVQKLDGKDYKELADNLRHKNPAGWQTAGDYHRWAETWATESVAVAEKAYHGIAFEKATLNEKHELDEIEIKLASSYEKTNEEVVANQLTKAGLRLADLLNHIQWK